MLAYVRIRTLTYADAAAGALAALSEAQLPLGGSLNVTAAPFNVTAGAGAPDGGLTGAADA